MIQFAKFRGLNQYVTCLRLHKTLFFLEQLFHFATLKFDIFKTVLVVRIFRLDVEGFVTIWAPRHFFYILRFQWFITCLNLWPRKSFWILKIKMINMTHHLHPSVVASAPLIELFVIIVTWIFGARSISFSFLFASKIIFQIEKLYFLFVLFALYFLVRFNTYSSRTAWNVLEFIFSHFALILANAKRLLHWINMFHHTSIKKTVSSHRGWSWYVIILLSVLVRAHSSLILAKRGSKLRFPYLIRRLMDIAHLILRKSFVLEVACLDLKRADGLNFGLLTLELFVMILSINFDPMREVFVLQQPQNLQVALSYHSLLRLRCTWSLKILLIILRTFRIWHDRSYYLYLQYVFWLNITTIEFKLVILC